MLLLSRRGCNVNYTESSPRRPIWALTVLIVDRRLTNGTVQCAGSATYGLGYQSRTLTLTLTLKVTKMYAVQNDTLGQGVEA